MITTNVLMIAVINPLVASILVSLVMMVMLVLLIPVLLYKDVNIPISFVLITLPALQILVILRKVAFLLL